MVSSMVSGARWLPSQNHQVTHRNLTRNTKGKARLTEASCGGHCCFLYPAPESFCSEHLLKRLMRSEQPNRRMLYCLWNANWGVWIN